MITRKKKNKIAMQRNNTHATMPESHPTPASIGLSQVQDRKKIFYMLHVNII